MTDVPDPEPDDEADLDPVEAERRIAEFVAGADGPPGPPVAVLADGVAELVRVAEEGIAALVAPQHQNKVVATFLLLGQRARGFEPSAPEHWRLHAAATLVSALLVPGERAP